MSKFNLFDYQRDMVNDIVGVLSYPMSCNVVHNKDKNIESYGSSVMVQMPTGTGKTVVMAAVVKWFLEDKKNDNDSEVWIVAHRRELVEQIEKTLAKFEADVPKASLFAKRFARIKVYSIQWLNRHLDEMTATPGLIIVDEAHHALAPIYQNVMLKYKFAMRIGMTATPCRLKAQSFTGIFEKLLTSMSVKEFIKAGYLSLYDYVVIGRNSQEQYIIDNLKKRATDGDYNIAEMNEKLNIKPSIMRLYDSVMKYAKGKKGIVYAIDIAHAKAIADYYTEMGLNVVALDSKTSAQKRADAVEKFRKGDIDCMVNVNLFDEGFDCPDVEYIQIARPTLSLSKYLQMVGRGLRVHKNKKLCVIIDNVGVYRSFGLPDKQHNWRRMFNGLDAGKATVVRRYRHGLVRETSMGDDMEYVMRSDKKPMCKKERDAFLANVIPYEQNKRWGLRSGDTIIIGPIYRHIYDFIGKYAICELAPNMYGLIARSGHLLTQKWYKSVEITDNGKYAILTESPIRTERWVLK